MEIGELPAGSTTHYPMVRIDHARAQFTMNGVPFGSVLTVIPLGLLRSRQLYAPAGRTRVCSSPDAINGFPRPGFPLRESGLPAATAPAACSGCKLRGYDAEGGWRCKQFWTVPFLFTTPGHPVHAITFSPGAVRNLEQQLIRFRDNNIPMYTEVMQIKLREVLASGNSFADTRFSWLGPTDPVGHPTYSAELQRFRAYMAEDTASAQPTFEGF